MRARTTMRGLVAGTVAALAFAGPAPLAAAEDGDSDDVRVRGRCTGASSAELRLRADDGRIRIEFRIDARPRGGRWQVVVLHERRIAFRGAIRASGGGPVQLRRTVADWFGTDAIAVRATGPRNQVCRASATV